MLRRFLLLLVVLLTAACTFAGEAPVVEDGEVSLADFDVEQQTAALSGRWRFQEGLVEPPLPLVGPTRIDVPGRWHQGDTAPLDSPFGEGTYTLRLTELPRAPALALEVEVAGAVEAYVDGELVASRGDIHPETRSSAWLPVVLPLPRGVESSEVRLLVANDAVRIGGITSATLGTLDGIEARGARRLVADVVNISVLVTFAAVFLVIGLRRQSEPAYALFAGLCICLALRDIFGGTGDLRDVILPDFPWVYAIKVDYATLPLGVITGWGTITHLTKMLRRHPLTWAILGSATILAILTFAVPVPMLRFVLPVSQVLMLFNALAVGVMLAIAAWRGDRRAIGFLVSMAIFVAAVTHDVLISLGLFETGLRLGTMGFLAVMFAFAILLMSDFVQSFLLNERLNAELQRSHGELQRTHKAVLRFVPRAFLRMLGKENVVEVARGDHAEVVMEILFCDLRSFTSLIESLGPDRAFPFINRYLRFMEPAITGNEGFISQYLGDCIMALFPGDDADRAVRAAVQMTVALREFNEREPEGPVRFGIGIASGPIMLGTIGGHERLDGGVIGDSVNHASRIEGMTKMYGTVLIIDETTARRLTGAEQVVLRELDRVVAKGRRTASSIYEVLDALPREEREAKLRSLDTWTEALALYRAGQLDRARKGFSRCLELHGRDEAARLFVHRCEVLAREGLPAGWTGTTVLTKK